jgi:acylphosphatase
MKVIISGQVQGVGFRWSVQRLAQQHRVTGTVRNLPDGSVEVVANGTHLEAFLHDLEHNPGAGRVTSLTIASKDETADTQEFRIVI